MKTKLLFGALALALIFTSCKKDNDVVSTMEKIGDDNMRGMYVGWLVDSAKMQSTMTQYVLDKEAYTGKLFEITSGNAKVYESSEANLTWKDKGYSKEGTSFLLDIVMGEQTYPMTWVHKALYDEQGRVYLSSLLDIYNTFSKTYTDFALLSNEWVYRDSTIYQDTTKVTQLYLEFKEVTSKDISIDSVNSLINYVELMRDSIHWYNKEFGKTVRDTVYYKENSKKPGFYNAIAAKGTEKSRVIESYTMVGNATEHFVSVQFGSQIGSVPHTLTYSAWTAAYDTNYYKHPEVSKYEIESVVIEDGMWTFSGLTNGKKFTILGKGTIKTHTEKNGEKKDEQKVGGFQEFVISAFSAKDKAMTLGEDKMKYTED